MNTLPSNVANANLSRIYGNYRERRYFECESERGSTVLSASSKSHLSSWDVQLRQRKHIDGYELRLSERLTRACRLRFARTNCQRAILVHLSQNISNMSITKSDRCRYSQRQNQRKRPEEKRTKTGSAEGWREKE